MTPEEFTNYILSEINTINKAPYFKNILKARFNELLLTFDHDEFMRPLQSVIISNSKIYIKHLSDKIFKQYHTIMINNRVDHKILSSLKDTQGKYMLLIGYGFNPNNKRMVNIDNVNSLPDFSGYNWDADIYVGGGVKNGETITNALKRECYEEIGMNLVNLNGDPHIFKNKDKTHYIYHTSPSNYTESSGLMKNNNARDNRKEKVNTLIYGSFDDMYTLLEKCKCNDLSESIRYYAIIELDVLLYAMKKRKDGHNTIIKIVDDNIEVSYLKGFAQFKDEIVKK
jgi:ADP-ribose pyrophosphatase YjhB (NUDIX family)